MSKPASLAKFSQSDLRLAAEIFKAQKVEEIAEKRRARGLLDRPILLRVVERTRYPALCTAGRVELPEEERCDGAHPQVGPKVELFPGDCIQQFPGEFPLRVDPRFVEISEDPSNVFVEDYLVTLPTFNAPIREIDDRIQSAKWVLENLRGQAAVIEAETGRQKLLLEQCEQDRAAAAARLENFLSGKNPEWAAKARAGRPAWSPAEQPQKPRTDLERLTDEYRAGGSGLTQTDFSLLVRAIEEGASFESAKAAIAPGVSAPSPVHPQRL